MTTKHHLALIACLGIALTAGGCRTTKTAASSTSAHTTGKTETATTASSAGSSERVIYLRDTVTVTERVVEYAPPVAFRDTVLVPIERVVYRTVESGANGKVAERDTVWLTSGAETSVTSDQSATTTGASDHTTTDRSGWYIVVITLGLAVILGAFGLRYLDRHRLLR